jgi:hypothetical protein
VILLLGTGNLEHQQQRKYVVETTSDMLFFAELPTKCLVIVFGRENRGIVEVEDGIEDCLVKEGGRGTSVPFRR